MQGDHVMMKDGKMAVVRDGDTMPMGAEITMTDRTRVMPADFCCPHPASQIR